METNVIEIVGFPILIQQTDTKDTFVVYYRYFRRLC